MMKIARIVKLLYLSSKQVTVVRKSVLKKPAPLATGQKLYAEFVGKTDSVRPR